MRKREFRRRRAVLRVLESTIATLTGGLILWWVTNPGARTVRIAAEPAEPKAAYVMEAAPTPTPQSFPPVETPREPETVVAPPLLSLPASQVAATAQSTPSSATAGGSRTSRPATVGPILFDEDFSRYADGPASDWGTSLSVKTGLDRRKWLVSYLDGTHAATRSLRLPARFNLQCRYSVSSSEVTRGLLGWWKEPLVSHVSFLDNRGVRQAIQWTIRYGNDTARFDVGNPNLFARKFFHSIKLPGGEAVEVGFSQPTGTLRIDRDGGLIKVLINSQLTVSGTVEQIGPLAGFEIDVVKSSSGSLCFTEFRVSR